MVRAVRTVLFFGLMLWLGSLAVSEIQAAAGQAASGVKGVVYPRPGRLTQFGFSYLLAFMIFLSICLGSLFLVIVHHLFDAAWSVPIRRFLEHIACLLPWMGVLFIPIALLAKRIYPWMSIDPLADHSLHVKQVLFNQTAFYVVAVGLFLVWTWLSLGLRKWSLAQDKTGDAICTHMMRRYSAAGIFIFAITLTLAAIYWMKSLQHQWYSTMYGVYYFAESVWVTLATTYLLAMMFKTKGPLRDVVGKRQFYDIGVLLFAFTVFYAYIHFSQYFLIWNAAIPEETFWYVLREKGSWWDIGMIIIFGHFVLPFLGLLRIDTKLSFTRMAPLCIWAWLMHYCDISFNIKPVLNPTGFAPNGLDLACDLVCLAFFAIVLSKLFFRSFNSHPPYPLKDPRLKEAITHHEIPPAPVAVGGVK